MQQPFSSPEEALAHYGVKGMKWGKRSSGSSSGPPSDKDTRSRSKKIDDARMSVAKTTHEYNKAKQLSKRGSSEKVRANNKAKLPDLKKAKLHNPDRATANKIKAGEATTLLLLGAAGGPILKTTVAATVGVNAAARAKQKVDAQRIKSGKL